MVRLQQFGQIDQCVQALKTVRLDHVLVLFGRPDQSKRFTSVEEGTQKERSIYHYLKTSLYFSTAAAQFPSMMSTPASPFRAATISR